jgi:pyruvate formate lyase activating enzyme
MQMLKEMCKWLKKNGLSEAPLHYSRFFPRYKMQDTPPTPRQTLYAAKQIAEEEGIKHVYLGNI